MSLIQFSRPHFGLKIQTAPTIEPVTLTEAKRWIRLDSGSLSDNLASVQSIFPGDHTTAAAYSLKGTGVEVLGYSALVVFSSGTNGSSGTVDVKLQESDTDIDGDYTDVASGAFTQVTEANDNASYELAYSGSKRYIRAVATVAVATCDFGVSVLRESPYSTEDDDVTDLIVTAREYCEGVQERAYITQTWNLTLEAFPDSGVISLPLPPLISVTAAEFKYYDGANTLTVLPAAYYVVDTASEPGRICLAYGYAWPSTYQRPDAIVVRFVAGYGATAATVPRRVKHAMRLLIGAWFRDREATGTLTNEIAFSVTSLLNQDKLIGL